MTEALRNTKIPIEAAPLKVVPPEASPHAGDIGVGSIARTHGSVASTLRSAGARVGLGNASSGGMVLNNREIGVLPNPIVECELQPERDSTLMLRAEWNITGVLVLAP